MTSEGQRFDLVLEDPSGGYAEADPSFDIAGIDSAHKLALWSVWPTAHPQFQRDLPLRALAGSRGDLAYAKEFGFTIKLLAIAKYSDGRIEARVHPTWSVPISNRQGDGVYNAIQLVATPWRMSSSMAAVPDRCQRQCGSQRCHVHRAQLLKNARDAFASSYQQINGSLTDAANGRNHVTLLYSFHGRGRPVCVPDCRSMGRYGISISSVLQQGRKEGQTVPVVIMSIWRKSEICRTPFGTSTHALHFRATPSFGLKGGMNDHECPTWSLQWRKGCHAPLARYHRRVSEVPSGDGPDAVITFAKAIRRSYGGTTARKLPGV